jgi:spore maturation protein CgeB
MGGAQAPEERRMRLVVLGLSLSSSWGNGHATTYRALLKAFAARGHDILFLERDVPWYADNRDLDEPDYCRLALYSDLRDLATHAREIETADAVMVGSYVPEGVDVGEWVQRIARGVTAFYDIDTPVTLAKLDRGELDYLSPALIPRYGLYLSFTGGPTLQRIMDRYGAPVARALYCSVDPECYAPVDLTARWDLSYLGTYSPDRQPTLERLLVEPARRAPQLKFAVAGPLYPDGIQWPANVERIDHVAPADHPRFYASSRFTLNVTRADMIRAGYSPSVRLFEAAATGTPIVSDAWPGLETIFVPGREIVVAERPDEVLQVLTGWNEPERQRVAAAARKRVLSDHTAAHRAAELERHIERARSLRVRTRDVMQPQCATAE